MTDIAIGPLQGADEMIAADNLETFPAWPPAIAQARFPGFSAEARWNGRRQPNWFVPQAVKDGVHE
jgi:hypothetical protein